jgi:hypothetical protein
MPAKTARFLILGILKSEILNSGDVSIGIVEYWKNGSRENAILETGQKPSLENQN